MKLTEKLWYQIALGKSKIKEENCKATIKLSGQPFPDFCSSYSLSFPPVNVSLRDVLAFVIVKWMEYAVRS